MATFLRYILMVVEAVCCLMLIGVILVQRTKSQGLGMAMGGQMGEALFGARMGNVLTRVTVVLGIVFLVNTTLLAYLGATSHRNSVTDGAVPAAAPASVMPPPGAAPLNVPLDSLPAAEAPAAEAPAAEAPVAVAPVAVDAAPVAETAPVEPTVIPPVAAPAAAE